MKKLACLILSLAMVLALGAVAAGCAGNTGNDNAVYYSVSVDGGSGAGKYREGFICTARATVPDGKQFMKWLKNGQEASVNAEYAFNVTENTRLIAVFGDKPSNSDSEVCLVKADGGIGSGGYIKGESCTVHVYSEDRYRDFKGWVSVVDGTEGEILSESPDYTFTVTEDIVLRPLFKNLRLRTPDNSDNKMFNLIAGHGVIEYDRQVDPVTGTVFTAFTEGVAYIKVYVYVSADDDALPVAQFKLVKREDGSGFVGFMDSDGEAGDGRHQDMSGLPGSYYTPDGSTHNMLKNIISAGTMPYDTNKTYYFATQAVAVQPAEGEEAYYLDSAISGKGRGVKNM